MVDLETTCRTCMRNDGSFVDLFVPLKIETVEMNSSLNLADVLMEAMPLQIAKEDGLPQKLCEECTKIIQIMHSFRIQAINCENEFKRLITAARVKNETTETDIKYENDNDSMNGDDFFQDDFLNEENELYTCVTCNRVCGSYSKLVKHSCVHKDTDFVCQVCSKRFHHESLFKKHMSKHEESDLMHTEENGVVTIKSENFKCPECSVTLESELKLLSHLKEHEIYRVVFNCDQCDAQFVSSSLFIEHKSQHVDEQKHTCHLCLSTFRSLEKLEKHLGTHSTSDFVKHGNQFQCSKCNVMFKQYKSLITHLKKHLILGNNYVCDFCGREFTAKGPLKRHLALHSEIRPYKCTVCPKSYSRQDALTTHIRKHSGVKPYPCKHCDKAFMQLCSLKDHLRTHTGETPFLCSECGRGFNNSSNLRQHIKRHSGVKPFSCTLCPKAFCTKGQMKNHLDTHTGIHPYKCNECGSTFTKPNSLKKHKMIHLGIKPFACDTCSMSFSCKDHLKRHQRKHTGEKPYKCERCDRAFTQSNDLIKHMRRHVGQDIYSCTVCGARFRLMKELKQHYPVHYSGTEHQSLDKPVIILKGSNDMERHDTSQEGHITITFNSNILDKESSGDITINIDPERID